LARTASAEVTLQTRLLRPMQRIARGAATQPMEWQSAIDMAADRFAATIAEHGPDAVGFYLSGQLLTEDYHAFNKLARGLIGTNNIDTNSRLCMSSAVSGYKETLGADAPPACYDDIAQADCLFIAGSNTAWAHPILFRRIEDARAANPALKMIVVDPRRTETAAVADLHLQIQPGTDVMLFHGMLHTMLWEGWTDALYIAAHTTGFDALKALVRDCTPEKVARVCGIAQADLIEAARLFATSRATLSLYCQGLNQSTSGTSNNAALIGLHLATAQIGRAGAGPLSLTGQPNAMGGREVGGMATLLPGHRDLANADHRAEVAALWGVPAIPSAPGLTAVEMFEAAADGQIRALWIACTNPAQSMPDQATVRRALERCEFVVVQEAFATTATCDFADLLLPATSWGEKTGTVTNSERRISRVRVAVPGPGDTRHDWAIATAFSEALERRLRAPDATASSMRNALEPVDGPDENVLFENAPLAHASSLFCLPVPVRIDASMSFADADLGVEALWLQHRAGTTGRDLDISGLSWSRLDAEGPQQWPFPADATTGTARLYEEGRFPTADGRARFAATPWKPVAEERDARYPFALNTGRLRDQWHGMSRTGTLGRLFSHVPEPAVELHASDMARLGIAAGDLVHLTSRRGSIIVAAQASNELAPMQAFLPMHWGSEVLGGSSSVGTPLAGANALTQPAFCPTSKQPELKHCAVKVLKAALPWSLVAMAWLPNGVVLAVQQALREHMGAYPFASCVPFSNRLPIGADASAERTGLVLRAAAHEAAPDALLEQIESLLQLRSADTLRYADQRHGQRRCVRLVQAARAGGAATFIEGFLLAGDTRSGTWISTLLQSELPAQSYGRRLLVGSAQPPGALAPRARQVCNCLNVSEPDIAGFLAACGESGEDARFDALRNGLRCGTSCGSCIPQLRQLVRAQSTVVALP
jgi:assimilatory nitrate reductase catalytic subunit